MVTFNTKDFDEMTLYFLESKGFNRSTLLDALSWLRTADADELMLGSGNGDSLDVMMGELRRPLLIASVERLIGKQ